MRYAYGVTSALLLGGAMVSLVTGVPAGAQVAQNDASEMRTVVPRAGAPASFADLTEQLMARADAAMYAAKRAGRNRVAIADASPETTT